MLPIYTAIIPSFHSAAAPPSYLVEENFEGTGTPSGWIPIGTVDFDYTTTVLQGVQSCYLDGTSAWAAILLPGISPQSECWVYFLLQPPLELPRQMLCSEEDPALSSSSMEFTKTTRFS